MICIRNLAPIHLCAAADHCDLLEILFKHNADVNRLVYFDYLMFEIYRLIYSMVKDKLHYIMQLIMDMQMLVDFF